MFFRMEAKKPEKMSQTRSARQLSTAVSKAFAQKHQHTSSMPGFVARKALSKSPIKPKSPEDPLSKTGSFALVEATTPPSHKRKRSLSASRRPEPLTPPSPEPLAAIAEDCSNCERLRQREKLIVSALCDLQYQLSLHADAVTSWRAGQVAALELPRSAVIGEQFAQDDVGRALASLGRELAVLRTVLADLTKDVELLSRHAAWENVTIVKRKDAKEAMAGKVREARALLSTLRQACGIAKAPPPAISPTDPLLVRGLKLQLQEVIREKLLCELKLRTSGEAEGADKLLRELVQEVQVT